MNKNETVTTEIFALLHTHGLTNSDSLTLLSKLPALYVASSVLSDKTLDKDIKADLAAALLAGACVEFDEMYLKVTQIVEEMAREDE